MREKKTATWKQIHLYRATGGWGSTAGLYHCLFFSAASRFSHLLLFGFLTMGCLCAPSLSFSFSLCQSAFPHQEVSLCFSPPSLCLLHRLQMCYTTSSSSSNRRRGCLFCLFGQPLRRLDSLHVFFLFYSLFFSFFTAYRGVGKHSAAAVANNFQN